MNKYLTKKINNQILNVKSVIKLNTDVHLTKTAFIKRDFIVHNNGFWLNLINLPKINSDKYFSSDNRALPNKIN